MEALILCSWKAEARNICGAMKGLLCIVDLDIKIIVILLLTYLLLFQISTSKLHKRIDQ